MRTLIISFVLCCAGLSGAAAGQEVDPAKVLVIVELSPRFSGTQGDAARKQLVDTLEASRTFARSKHGFSSLFRHPFGGFTPVVSTHAVDPQAQAEAAGCDVLLHVQIISREVQGGGFGADYRLQATASLYRKHAAPPGRPGRPAGKSGWKSDWNRQMMTEGFASPAGNVNDCERLTQELGAVLLRHRFPYKMLGGNMNGIRLSITNPTTRPLSNLQLGVPMGNKYGPEIWNTQETVEPGATKTVTFTRGDVERLPGARYDFRSAYLAELQIGDHAAAPGARP